MKQLETVKNYSHVQNQLTNEVEEIRATLENARDELRKISENLKLGPGNRRPKRSAPLRLQNY